VNAQTLDSFSSGFQAIDAPGSPIKCEVALGRSAGKQACSINHKCIFDFNTTVLMKYRQQMTTPFLRQLVEEGLAGQLIARGVAGGFLLVMSTKGAEQVLSAQRGGPRVFRRLDTLAGFLKNLGANEAEIELGAWDGGGEDS
jgi:hypothetical protein